MKISSLILVGYVDTEAIEGKAQRVNMRHSNEKPEIGIKKRRHAKRLSPILL
ncbi:hypothetical protein SOASR030_01470 [Leminorella grimontii]|uniref:Uncharacterized protein n=1 Tax=Leminorella grimontii TaxID=82981 RepID=A0AAV5MXJ5_9GAMM|nr:hypothetical protein SOASR030_01470 [Leminorella grimontii]